MANEQDAEKLSLNGTNKVQARIVPAPANKPASTNKPPSSVKKRSKNVRPPIGGTAVPGAKSTLPKPVSTSTDQNQQQAESSNRTMRRRMEQLGTGPASPEERGKTLQERRKKQADRRKEKLEERRSQLRKNAPPGIRNAFNLGRNNAYFLIATVAIVIILIVVFILLHQFHVIG